MTARVDLALWVGAAASVALAVGMYLGRPGGSDCEQAEASSAGGSPTRRSTEPRPGGKCDRTLLACEAIVRDCGAAHDSCAAEVEDVRGLKERFAALPPGTHRADHWKAKVEPALAAVENLEYTVECRDLICHVTLTGEGSGPGQNALQMAGMQWKRRGEFGTDPEADPPVTQAFVEVLDPDITPGPDVLRQIVEAYQTADAPARCHATHGESGELLVNLEIDPQDGLQITPVGGFRRTKTGACVVEAVKVAAAGVPIPDRVSGAMYSLEVHVPAGE